MTIYNIHEAKTHFFKLIEQVLQGENIVIAKAGKPVARNLPFVAEDLSPRVPGIDKGKAIILPDFDETLPEFDL
ncbi:MAG: type II toxin-antitoxin system prevent-host-death family antitoxin [Chloroflexi bacterium HGW-Chloroflexi-5]|nr:MAG: type II toxin-antitoxin system prevent-host-death family antitoxin [Chloroflexi bacterium HGW-Chloroflexi-5]